MDFSNHKFRCSSLGYIMADARGKSNKQLLNENELLLDELLAKYSDINKGTKAAETMLARINKVSALVDKYSTIADIPLLSDTCKTHLSDVYTRTKYNRTEDIRSKYLEKGLQMEEDAITLYSMISGEFHKKNDERRSNDFIEGSMDFEKGDFVFDTKVNWSIFQFNRVASRAIKPLYHWQLDGYMWLWNKTNARLVYCLVNTPEMTIQMEIRKLMYEFFGGVREYEYAKLEDESSLLIKSFEEAVIETRRNHTYDDIPIEERIRTFDIKRNDERIDMIKQRVADCRIYLNNIDNNKIDEDEIESS